MKAKTIIEIICFLVIVLFVYAAVSKLIDVEKFRIQIGQSPLLTAFAGWIAWIIPITELLISVMLSFERTRLAGLYAGFGLMVAFTNYIIAILQFSTYIPCSCGGILQNMGWTAHLIFNIAFVILLAAAVLLTCKIRIEEEIRFSKDNDLLQAN